MKRVLITGANSYIGISVENWLSEFPEDFEVYTLDMQNPNWRKFDFSSFDIVFHVAGIAHFSKDESKKDLYYQVNTQLTKEVAIFAKARFVKQFIFMSSIIVYGDSSEQECNITDETSPSPSDFYGDSKWQAEIHLQKIADSQFKVAIIRPPMIYGKNSKGNYRRLANLARKLPVFPNFPNKRSMLHIDNLCEFIKQIILGEKSGIFFPQNKEYVSTVQLVEEIAEYHGHKIYTTKIANFLIQKLFFNDNIKKLFGNLTYDKRMSVYDFEYQIRDFQKSIQLTEGPE